MFRGLNAFPLTPLAGDRIDEKSFIANIERLSASGVDAITALGSTGVAAYLSHDERTRVAELAVRHAGTVPVAIGVSALRTSQVLEHIAAAERAGAQGLLLAPVSYQPLTEHDVFELFRTVSERTDLPVIVYDNPGTTHFTFSLELYARITELPGIASIKIPAVPTDPEAAAARIAAVRAVIPEHVTIGVSGDMAAASGLNAGCDAWYSVLGGTLPDLALRIARPALAGAADEATAASAALEPIWELFRDFGGSIRVIAAIAEALGYAPAHCLPLPIQGLNKTERERVLIALGELGLLARG
jgi:4-hydroxy-tetrahydrodipicolinate synthase